jgi:hypothetical protein
MLKMIRNDRQNPIKLTVQQATEKNHRSTILL